MEYVYKGYAIPYMICFCVVRQKVLMLYRNREPNAHKWNGIGGKFEDGERLEESLQREVWEEAGIDVKKGKTTYTGVITWDTFTSNNAKGMYAYIVEFEKIPTMWNKREISEGILEWKNVNWVLEKKNKEIVSNIPYFFPEMLMNKKPMHYHCEYTKREDTNVLVKFTTQGIE